MTEVCSAGFPHSEICGSSDMCSLPQLIAAYHVFLRLLVPRHPPCALLRLTLQLSLVRILSSLIHRSVVYKVFLNLLLPLGSSLNFYVCAVTCVTFLGYLDVLLIINGLFIIYLFLYDVFMVRVHLKSVLIMFLPLMKFDPASTCSSTSSPMQYHRPLMS